jgi:hypothetical protein
MTLERHNEAFRLAGAMNHDDALAFSRALPRFDTNRAEPDAVREFEKRVMPNPPFPDKDSPLLDALAFLYNVVIPTLPRTL